jgi:hypothetical protein
MTIEVDDRTAKLISELRRQAEAKGMSLDAYLERMLKADDLTGNPDAITAQQFDQLLDELSGDLPPLDPLPDDFSRADIYTDHD